MSSSDPYSGFYRLSRQARLTRLLELKLIDDADYAVLVNAVHSDYCDQAEKLIENVMGCFPMPLGVVPGVKLDGVEVSVPMVVEETSIIAALNRTAKWVRTQGTLTTSHQGNCMIGQLHIPYVRDFSVLKATVLKHEAAVLAQLNETVLTGLAARGGGAQALVVRCIQRPGEAGDMAVIHLHCAVCDAMGANLVNMAVEALKPRIEALTQESIQTCIVSNLSDTQMTRATLVMNGIPSEIRTSILKTAEFAELDPYRAATHNKGVMNAIDAVMIATGNDWRAVEASVHAYAARAGQYQAITRWTQSGDQLIGHFEAPISVGIVGGMTAAHPMAKLALKMMGVQEASQLARIAAAVGLMQNLAALNALATDGIVQGHMRLHIDNLVMASGAKTEEMDAVRACLETVLAATKKVTLTDAMEALSALRVGHVQPITCA